MSSEQIYTFRGKKPPKLFIQIPKNHHLEQCPNNQQQNNKLKYNNHCNNNQFNYQFSKNTEQQFNNPFNEPQKYRQQQSNFIKYNKQSQIQHQYQQPSESYEHQEQNNLSQNKQFHLLDLRQNQQNNTKNINTDINYSSYQLTFSSNLDHQSHINQVIRRKKQHLMQYKVKQLQRICAHLTNSNRKLLEKLQFLESVKYQYQNKDQYQEKNKIFQQEHSQTDSQYQNQNQIHRQKQHLLNKQIHKIQEKLNQYRIQLETSQQRVAKQLFQKQKLNLKLNQQIQRLQAKNLVLQKKLNQYQFKNTIYRNKAYELQSEIRSISKRSKNKSADRFQKKDSFQNLPKFNQNLSKSQIKNAQKDIETDRHIFDRKGYQQQFDFQMKINQQLQELVNKLVNQLQIQKKNKKNFIEQIKRLGKQLMDNQRQIMQKNNKIYQLETNLLKLQKKKAKCFKCQRYLVNNMSPVTDRSQNSLPQTIQMISNINNHHTRRQSFGQNLRETRSKYSETFTFMQLIEEKFKINGYEKMFIMLKTVQFFQRRIEQKDYSQVMIENLQVINFNNKNLNLLLIRDKSRIKKSKYQTNSGNQHGHLKNLNSNQSNNKENLVWNMGFVLDNLLNQVNEQQTNNSMNNKIHMNIYYQKHKKMINKQLDEMIDNRKGDFIGSIQKIKQLLLQVIYDQS